MDVEVLADHLVQARAALHPFQLLFGDRLDGLLEAGLEGPGPDLEIGRKLLHLLLDAGQHVFDFRLR